MPLQLNLLHEEFTQERQRKRDPLKLGLMGLGTLGAFMLAYYALQAYQTLVFKNQLSAIEQEWAKAEPQVTLAQKRITQLTGIINATNVLDNTVEGRFFWAPLLQTVSGCVAPNIQLTSLDGTVTDDKTARIAIEGLAAGEEPRAAAEEFRQLLSEKLAERYGGVDVEFKTLEDLETPVMLAGASLPASHYAITLSLKPKTEAAAVPSPAPVSEKTKK